MLKDGSKIVRKEYTKYHKSPKYINMQYYVKKGGLIQIHEFEIYTRNSKRNSYFIDTVFEDKSMRRDRLDYDEEAMATLEAESIILNKTRVDSIEKPNFTCVMYEYEEK